MSQDEDSWSVFSDEEGGGDVFRFKISALSAIVSNHFRKRCVLQKLGEGGYHKVRLDSLTI